MYTLKIRWTRHAVREPEPPTDTVNAAFDASMKITSLEDETTLFIPADQIRVHGYIPAGERASQMKHWDEDSAGYFNYLSVHDHGEIGGRLISVVHDGVEEFYLASHAWILGPSGGTIERVAP